MPKLACAFMDDTTHLPCTNPTTTTVMVDMAGWLQAFPACPLHAVSPQVSAQVVG